MGKVTVTGITLAICHKWFVRLWVQGLIKGDEHPTYISHGVWSFIPFSPFKNINFYVYGHHFWLTLAATSNQQLLEQVVMNIFFLSVSRTVVFLSHLSCAPS